MKLNPGNDMFLVDNHRSVGLALNQLPVENTLLMWSPGPSLRGVVVMNAETWDNTTLGPGGSPRFMPTYIFDNTTTNPRFRDAFGGSPEDNIADNITGKYGLVGVHCDYDPYSFDSALGPRSRVVDACFEVEFTNPASIVGFLLVGRVYRTETIVNDTIARLKNDVQGVEVIPLKPGRQLLRFPAWLAVPEDYDRYADDFLFGSETRHFWSLAGHAMTFSSVSWASTDPAPVVRLEASAKVQTELEEGMNHLHNKPVNSIATVKAQESLAQRSGGPGVHSLKNYPAGGGVG